MSLGAVTDANFYFILSVCTTVEADKAHLYRQSMLPTLFRVCSDVAHKARAFRHGPNQRTSLLEDYITRLVPSGNPVPSFFVTMWHQPSAARCESPLLVTSLHVNKGLHSDHSQPAKFVS